MNALQVRDDDEKAPLLPADRMKEVSYDMDAVEARDLNNFYQDEPKSKRRKRKFIHGALYQSLYAGYYGIDSAELGDVDLVVKDVATDSTTIIMIRCVAGENSLLNSLVQLGESLPKNGTCRRDVGDIGEMYGLGYRSKAKNVLYKQTSEPTTAALMRRVAIGVTRYMSDHFGEVLAGIKSAERKGAPAKALNEMGGDDGPGGTMMISRNLGNSSHYDYADQSHSFAIWVEKLRGVAGNWYFVMPNISINESKGVVVRLRHGVAISWDGRKIRHCSSVTDIGDDNNVYGCMFGSCRD
jgi:hypothetical protein